MKSPPEELSVEEKESNLGEDKINGEGDVVKVVLDQTEQVVRVNLFLIYIATNCVLLFIVARHNFTHKLQDSSLYHMLLSK